MQVEIEKTEGYVHEMSINKNSAKLRILNKNQGLDVNQVVRGEINCGNKLRDFILSKYFMNRDSLNIQLS